VDRPCKRHRDGFCDCSVASNGILSLGGVEALLVWLSESHMFEHPSYAVAVSYAGEDRPVVEQFVQLLADAGYRVFYYVGT